MASSSKVTYTRNYFHLNARVYRQWMVSRERLRLQLEGKRQTNRTSSQKTETGPETRGWHNGLLIRTRVSTLWSTIDRFSLKGLNRFNFKDAVEGGTWPMRGARTGMPRHNHIRMRQEYSTGRFVNRRTHSGRASTPWVNEMSEGGWCETPCME